MVQQNFNFYKIHPLRLPLWVIFYAVFALIYGVLGDPTPTQFDGITFLWGGAFILMMISILSSLNLYSFLQTDNNIPMILCGIFCITVPLVSGVLSGHDPFLITRDALSYFIVFIGLFFVSEYKNYGRASLKYILLGIISVAILMAMRRLGLMGYGTERLSIFQDPLALSVIPEITFSALFLISYAILSLLNQKEGMFKTVAISICLILLAAPMVIVIHFSVMRAGILALLVIMSISIIYLMMNRFAIGAPVFGLLTFLSLIFLQPILSLMQPFLFKTSLVGFNNRLEEWKAVIGSLSENVIFLIFGKGWGATLDNPAVGGETVLYTHSILSSSFYKGGVLLLMLTVFYLGWLLTRIFQAVFRQKDPFLISLSMALAMTFLINIFIYGGYKTIGFGLLTALAIGVFACYGKDNKEQEEYSFNGR